jgi:glycosyltransferase involved in cell wall biosynthesis
MLLLGIDGRWGEIGRGIGTYVRELVQGLAELDEDFTLIIFLKDGRNISWIPADSRFTIRVLRSPSHVIWEQFIFPLALFREKVQLLHCPALTAPLFFPKTTKLVLTIHDLIFLLPRSEVPRPTTIFHRLQWAYYSFFVPLGAKRATRIITVSENSAKDIQRILRMGEQTIRVIYEAASKRRQRALLKEPSVPKNFFLALGGDDPRKMTQQIVEAFKSFNGRREKGQLGLIVTGATPHLRRFFSKLGDSDITLLDYVDDDELAWLYSHCDAFLYPSIYEGFGLPLLEAMGHGAPIITVHRSSIPEVAGTCPIYVEPTTAGIQNGMERVSQLSIEDRITRINAGLERSRYFTWERAVRLTFEVYVEAMSA